MVVSESLCPKCNPSAGLPDSQGRTVGRRKISGALSKAFLVGGLPGAGVAILLVVAFLLAMSGKGGEAGADWAFVALLASPYIVSAGVVVGMVIAGLTFGLRSLLKRESGGQDAPEACGPTRGERPGS
jgi:hypothetical protein